MPGRLDTGAILLYTFHCFSDRIPLREELFESMLLVHERAHCGQCLLFGRFYPFSLYRRDDSSLLSLLDEGDRAFLEAGHGQLGVVQGSTL